MVTLEEKDILDIPTEISEEEDLQNRVDSLRMAILNGDIPDDLKDFITSLQKDKEKEVLDEETESLDDFVEQPYEVDVDESLADKDDSFLQDKNISIEDLNNLF